MIGDEASFTQFNCAKDAQCLAMLYIAAASSEKMTKLEMVYTIG